MIVIKQLEPAAIHRLGEIDRTEHITTGYFYRDGKLEVETVDWPVSPWSPGDGPHSVGGLVHLCLPTIRSFKRLPPSTTDAAALKP